MKNQFRIHKPCVRKDIEKMLDSFDANIEDSSSNESYVNTSLDGHTLRSVRVSKLYQLFDFKTFVRSILEEVENTLKVEEYVLEIRKGTQEVSLLGKPFKINGDEYRSAFYILNSNDRTRALQFSAGLYMTKTKNEVFMPIPDASTVRKVVHKGSSFATKVEKMNEFIRMIPGLVEYQTHTLKELARKEMSLREFLTAVVNENREGLQYSNAALVRANAFTRQMVNNKFDKLIIDNNKLTPTELLHLKTPLTFLRETNADLTINVYRAFLWYIQIYLNRDVSVARRECTRFYKFIEDIGVVERITAENDALVESY